MMSRAKNLQATSYKLPAKPGVYLFKDEHGQVIYVGKAANLRRRVFSYWQKKHEDLRIQKLVEEVANLDFRMTPTVIEALILEAELIKKYQPKFNIREKDNKSFLYVAFTREKFPKPIFIRENELNHLTQNGPIGPFCVKQTPRASILAPRASVLEPKYVFGPFVQASSIRAALRILRKIFPYSNCIPHLNSPPTSKGSRGGGRPCFNFQIGLCPGVCVGAISSKDYLKNIKNLILFFRGKKQQVLRNLKTEMKKAAKVENFEQAGKLRNQIYALEHIHDTALIVRDRISNNRRSDLEQKINVFGRIEGYDISNISGASAVGSMVVFEGGEPAKSQYRKFKIKTIKGINDVGMLREVLRRRFTRFKIYDFTPRQSSEQGFKNLPDLILIDGGIGQVNAAEDVLKEYNLNIPIIGIAKGFMRREDRPIYDKENSELGRLVQNYKDLLLQVRDEAHRFAISYHRKLRNKHGLNSLNYQS